jgi:hypothetical protein
MTNNYLLVNNKYLSYIARWNIPKYQSSSPIISFRQQVYGKLVRFVVCVLNGFMWWWWGGCM